MRRHFTPRCKRTSCLSLKGQAHTAVTRPGRREGGERERKETELGVAREGRARAGETHGGRWGEGGIMGFTIGWRGKEEGEGGWWVCRGPVST